MEIKVVNQYLKIKLKIGNQIPISKNVKSVMQSYKKYQVVIILHVPYVDMNGVGYVVPIILISILVNLILLDVQVCRTNITTAKYLFILKEYSCFYSY